MTHQASSRGMLFSPLPDYDVFKGPRGDTRADEPEETDATDEPERPETSSPPVMARANWTGTVPADD